MAFFNVKVQVTKRFFYVIESDSAAQAELDAKAATERNEKNEYFKAVVTRSVAVDPDTI